MSVTLPLCIDDRDRETKNILCNHYLPIRPAQVMGNDSVLCTY